MYTAGIDIGSVSTEIVVMRDGKFFTSSIAATGSSSKRAAEELFERTCIENRLKREQFDFIVTTGYGRKSTDIGDTVVTELSCHARGAWYLDSGVRTVIDIGGQDSKVIKVDNNGKGLDFIMNDKCAAGTGRFLEVMARALEVDVQEMGEIALGAQEGVAISSMCTVFAESEVVSFIAEGCPREKIIRGLMDSVATRVSSMVHRLGIESKVMLTGGVAKNKGVVQAMREKIRMEIVVSEEPQIVGALGAALIGGDELMRRNGQGL
jgi:predicted CoA-substrate-specific enzyme activase